MFFYEIQCRCKYDDWYKYIYISSPSALRSVKEIATNNKIPEKVKLLIDDRYLYPVQVRVMNVFEYLYYKYIKKEFHLGARVDWEKEEL